MLYQPSYPYPYLSDIDATDDNTFYCYINAEGGTTVNAYNYTITDLSGQQIYKSEKQTLATPLYSQQVLYMNVSKTSGMINGRDYVWRVQLYESNADIWVAFGTVQEGENTTTRLYLRKNYLVQSGDWIVINSQKVRILEYSSETGIATLATPLSAVPTPNTTYNIYSDNVTSNDYLFYARSAASLSIDNVPQTLTSKSYTFTGSYTQAQNVNYKYFVWTLYDELEQPIATTGEVTTGAIAYTFDGFASGETYGIGLMLENQDGSIISVPVQYFSVEYEQPEAYSKPNAEVDCDKDAIRIFWTPLLINDGVAEGVSENKYAYIYNQPYEGGSSVRIFEGCDITWDIGSENAVAYFDYDSTTYINWHTTNPEFNGVLYKQEGVPLDLIAIAPVAPDVAHIDDKYYNSSDNLIYTAISDNVWGTGIAPLQTVMYRLTTTNQLYIYDGTTLTATTYQPPSYTISYDTGAFHYTIINGDTNITGSVRVADIQVIWLLQPEGADPQQIYAWVDGDKWADDLLWTESTKSFVDKFWFKITLLPTGIQVVANAIPTT